MEIACLVFGPFREEGCVNEPCVQEVSGYDIIMGEKEARGLLCMRRLRPTRAQICLDD